MAEVSNGVQQGVNVSPLAIMAALVFHTGEEENAKIQPDDGAEAIKTRVPVIELLRDVNGEVGACVIPMRKIMTFIQNVYDVQFAMIRRENGGVGDDCMLVTFEKRSNTATILGPSGNGIIRSDSKRAELLKRLGL